MENINRINKGNRTTHATSDLGIWLNGKIGFAFVRFDKLENSLNLVSNPHKFRTL